jgi:hypothetical protein
MRHQSIILLTPLLALACSDDTAAGAGSDTTTNSSPTSTASPAVDTTSGSESGSGSESESGSDSSSGSESSSTTGPMPCVSDEECTDAEAPFCGVSGECGTCDGSKDPEPGHASTMKTAINPARTPVTKGSRGAAAATLPNVCNMPGPHAPFVPTPLPNIARSGSSLQGTTKTVKIEGHRC